MCVEHVSTGTWTVMAAYRAAVVASNLTREKGRAPILGVNQQSDTPPHLTNLMQKTVAGRLRAKDLLCIK